MDYIFKAGSCTKGELYDTIINALINAGWKNISSNPEIDGDVMFSTGINGDKKLCFQFNYYDNVSYPMGSASVTAYSTKTTMYQNFAIRFPGSYTPGAVGAAGTVERPKRAWKIFYPINYNAGVGLPPSAVVNYYLYVDKNKLIMATKMADTYSTKWNLFYIGVPDTSYAIGEDSRELLYSSNSLAGLANGAWMSNYPDKALGDVGDTYYATNFLSIAAPRSPNLNAKYFLSDIYVKTDAYGMIAKMDGVYSLNATNIMSGDIVTVGTAQYLIFDLSLQIAGTSCGWPTYAMAIRIQ